MANEVVRGEAVAPVLTQSETGRLEKQAQQHYSRAQIGVILFASDLARLQNGNAHKVRGYGQFGKYCEAVFEGVTASNAQQLVRQGLVLLKLEESGRLELNEREQNLPGTTGLRELSAIAKRFGDDAMLQTWDVAVKTGRKVVNETVLAALGTFIQIEAPKDAPELVEKTEEEETEHLDEYGEGVSDKERELIDRIRDLSFELPDALAELEEVVKQLRAEQKGSSRKDDERWIAKK